MDQANKQNMDEAQKKQDIITFFDKDASFVFVYKKTEKLVSAVYMVSNLFPENEPIRLAIRRKSSDLLSYILMYKDVKASNLSDFVYEAHAKILELVSMLEVSMLGGLVSNMNFNILKSEFSNLANALNADLSSQKESRRELIASNFFNVPEPEARSVYGTNNRLLVSSETGNVAVRNPYGQVKDNTQETVKDEFKRSNRQNIILGLIKKKKEVTIKDIALVIKDCSEKTIQRELISFMNAGVLKRTGERRWSKYSLV